MNGITMIELSPDASKAKKQNESFLHLRQSFNSLIASWEVPKYPSKDSMDAVCCGNSAT